jgi:hypothetical protein
MSTKDIGLGPVNIERPMLEVQPDCRCSWVVAKAGPGSACVLRLKRQNALCRYRHREEGP